MVGNLDLCDASNADELQISGCNFYAKLRRVDLHFIFNVSCIYILHSSDSVHFFNQFSNVMYGVFGFSVFFLNMVKWVSLKPITCFLKLIFHVLDLETEGFEHFVSRYGFRRIWLLVFVYRSCVFWILKPSHNFDFKKTQLQFAMAAMDLTPVKGNQAGKTSMNYMHHAGFGVG